MNPIKAIKTYLRIQSYKKNQPKPNPDKQEPVQETKQEPVKREYKPGEVLPCGGVMCTDGWIRYPGKPNLMGYD